MFFVTSNKIATFRKLSDYQGCQIVWYFSWIWLFFCGFKHFPSIYHHIDFRESAVFLLHFIGSEGCSNDIKLRRFLQRYLHKDRLGTMITIQLSNNSMVIYQSAHTRCFKKLPIARKKSNFWARSLNNKCGDEIVSKMLRI